MTVSVIHMSTGSTIVSEVHEVGPILIAKNPIAITIRTMEDDTEMVYGYSFLPYMEKETMAINRHHVVAIGVPNDSLLKYYNNMIEGMKREENEASIVESAEEETDSFYHDMINNTIH
jgi:hypothetical protein